MNNSDLATPSAPFLETWRFEITFTSDTLPEPWQIRQDVFEQLRKAKGLLDARSSQFEEQDFRNAIVEIVSDQLDGPDFRFFVTGFEERHGSWQVVFEIVGALYGGVCGYGHFRDGIDRIYSDLKALFEGIERIRVRLKKRFKERFVMQNPRIEPTLGLEKPQPKL